MASKIYDITPKISSRLAVFPGDQPFERRVAMSFAGGHHLELSSMLTTLHLGAHADAPSHYGASGVSIERRQITRYLGTAQVVRLAAADVRSRRVSVADFERRRTKVQAPRILFDTGTFSNPEQWTNEFASLEPALLESLADQGVVLVGIDTPSVDPAESKALEAHQVLLKRDLAVLEGLLLKDVPEGLYTLVALPLPIEGADASPVRAILLPEIPDVEKISRSFI